MHSKIVSIHHEPEFQKKCRIDLKQKMSRTPNFCPFCTARHHENIKNPSLKLETEFAYDLFFKYDKHDLFFKKGC